MQEKEHPHADVRQSKAVEGYDPALPVTRYEIAATLYQLLVQSEAAAAQPGRIAREVKPGRKSNLTPNPSKAKRYSDVPATHWAKASLQGVGARGINVVTSAKFEGDKSVMGDELAGWLDGLAGWIEGRPATAKSLAELVQVGYVPQTHPVLQKKNKPVSAQEASSLMVEVLVRAQERTNTASADSRYGKQ